MVVRIACVLLRLNDWGVSCSKRMSFLPNLFVCYGGDDRLSTLNFFVIRVMKYN